MKGKVKQGVDKVFEVTDDYMHEADDLKDTVVGTVKEKTGQMTHDKSLELKGRLQKKPSKSGLPKKLIYSLSILALLLFLIGLSNEDE